VNEENFHFMLHIKIKCKICTLEHQNRMMEVSSRGRRKQRNTLNKTHEKKNQTQNETVTEQLQKEKSDHTSDEKKQH